MKNQTVHKLSSINESHGGTLMVTRSRIILLIFLLWFLSSGVEAKEPHPETYNINELPEFTMDEITVTVDDPLHLLKMEVIRAEELKFDIFNSFNSTDDFDITCEWYTALGSRIKKWGCDVGYLKKASADDARDFVDSIVDSDANGPRKPLATRGQRTVELAGRAKELNREMITLAVEHPELAVAMIKANSLKQFYEAESKKRFKKNILAGNSKSDGKDVFLNEIDILEAAFLDHSRGLMPDEIWKRWDSLYRKIFQKKSYQIFWASAHENKTYTDAFVTYVQSLMSEGRQ